LSDLTSLPIDQTSRIGTDLQPETARLSTKRDSSGRKRRQPEQEAEPDDSEQDGRLLDVEA